MDTNHFDKPSLEIARERLSCLFAEYSQITGTPAALASEMVADDRAFFYRFKRTGLQFSTYDRVVGRFSTLWPARGVWPAAVPRQAPIALSAKADALIAELTAEKSIAARQSPKRKPVEASNGK